MQSANLFRTTLFQAGPFRDGSLFAKTRTRYLTIGQEQQYSAFLQSQQDALRRLSEYGDDVQIARQPPGTDEIIEVRLTGARIDDRGCSILADLIQLQSLFLDSTSVTNAGLVSIAELHCLTTLDLANTKIDSAGLDHLTKLSSLRVLNLHGTQVTDAGLERLAALTKLESLTLSHTLVTDAGLRHLSGLQNLKLLNLQQIRMTDAGSEQLKGLTDLRVLRLGSKDLTDTTLRHLTCLKNLEELSLTNRGSRRRPWPTWKRICRI